MTTWSRGKGGREGGREEGGRERRREGEKGGRGGRERRRESLGMRLVQCSTNYQSREAFVCFCSVYQMETFPRPIPYVLYNLYIA